MAKRIHPAALSAALLLAAGAVSAQGTSPMLEMHGKGSVPPAAAAQGATDMHGSMMSRRGPQSAFDGWQLVGGEAGWVLAPLAATASAPRPHAMRGAGLAYPAARSDGEIAAGGWQFTGGEAGWTLAQHRFEFEGGKLVHAHQAWCVASHAMPAPSNRSLSDQDPQWSAYRGA